MVILHGDNLVLSRKELENLKNKNKDKEIVSLDGKTLKLTELKEAIEAKSLFGAGKLVIIENFFTKQKPRKLGPKDKNSELDYLSNLSDENNLILWEGKEISKSSLSLFKKAEVKIFKIEKLIFSFVEALRPNNTQAVINLLRRCLQNNNAEIIFSMLVRQFRFLLLTKSVAKAGPEDYQRLAPWQKQRLTSQAKFFTMERLREIYQKLLEIDYKNKTGKSVYDLAKTLELFLTDI